MYQLVIADDDELIRNGLTRVVKWTELGFEVAASVASGTQALDYIRDHSVDVVLTDINMPEMTGLELIRRAKACRPELKSVIISGYSEFEYAKSAIDLKVESYLLKPLSPGDISKVFVRLKTELDAVRDGSLEESRKIKREYELMQILKQKIDSSLDFSRLVGTEKFCEVVFIKIFEGTTTNEYVENIEGCAQALKLVLMDYFFCELDRIFVALIRPDRLGKFILSLEEAFSAYHQVNHRISIGREAYSRSEIISSYWSAVELVKETERSNLVHYSRGHSRFKKDWYVLHDLEQKLMHEIEASQPLRVEECIVTISEILRNYEITDARYSFVDVLERAVAYFGIEDSSRFILLGEAYGRASENEADFEALLTLFKRDINEVMEAVRASSDSKSKLIVNQAIQAIEDSYNDKNLTLASLANKLGVSYGYLSTIFAKNLDKSFKSCLVEVRMEKARQLLISRKYKIYEIADMVGYSSSRYFTDAFRKYFGSSPADYIARLRGDGAPEQGLR